jgi:retron-type reverse transcriptase
MGQSTSWSPHRMNVLASAEPRLASGGSVPAITPRPDSHYRKVFSRRTLRTAWQAVYSSGASSNKEETKKQVEEFSRDIESHLETIYRHLLKGKFKFLPAQGILIPRKGKRPRPIVKSPIPARIVQRAILEVLQSDPAIEPYYKNPASFGGIRGKLLGVPGAIRAVYGAIKSDAAKFYIKSDIDAFFTKIPRSTVLAKISSVIQDTKFQSLLEKATHVELDNLASLGASATFFPSYEIGVAQGCCLSPLLGNILLETFDKELNGRGITCIRYIDDFIILGPNSHKVEAAFRSALRILATNGLTAYNPKLASDKADMGEVRNGFEFLGCNIRPGMISPASKSRQRIIDSIKAALDQSQTLMDHPHELMQADLSTVATLADVNNILQGWGNQYAFCNDREVLKMLDLAINGMIENYWRAVTRRYAKFSAEKDLKSSRQLLGVHLLVDSKFDPIIDPLVD